MNKEEYTISQLESILRELKAGKEETSATVAIGPVGKKSTSSKGLHKLWVRFLGIRRMITTILIVILLAVGVWLYTGSTFKKESITFVEQVQELATLATAEAHLKVIIEQEDNKLFGQDIQVNLPGTKRELLLVVPATVVAGVDLQGVTSENLKIDEKKKELKLVLPHATLMQEPAIQMDKVQTFSDEGLLRGEVKWTEGFELATEAQMKLKEEAVEIGLLQTAEKSAEKVLTEFFGSLGYSVKITFK
ncbi:DUF4230 domain-containing protein [Fredinandcohnia humi]